MAKFQKILEICKQYAGNQVNGKRKVTQCDMVPTFSDLEFVLLSITAETFSIDSENYLFGRLNSECPNAIPDLITRQQCNQRRKLTRLLVENIRSSILVEPEELETTDFGLQEIQKVNRDGVLSVERPSDDDTQLCKATTRLLYKDGSKSRSFHGVAAQSQPASAKLQNVFEEFALWCSKV